MRTRELERRLEKLFVPPLPAESPARNEAPLPGVETSPRAVPAAASGTLAAESSPAAPDYDLPIEWIESARALAGDQAGAGAPERIPAGSNFLKAILDQIPDPVFIKDRHHRWVVVNSAFCERVGQPEDKLLGRTDHDYFPRALADDSWALDDRLFESGQPNAVERSIECAGGDVREWRIWRQPLPDASGSTPYLVGTIQDLTARRLAERALHERESKYRAERRQWEEKLRRLKRGLLFQFTFFGMLAGLSVSVVVTAPERMAEVSAGAPEGVAVSLSTPAPAGAEVVTTPALPATETIAPRPTTTPTAQPPRITIASTFVPQPIAADGELIVFPPTPAPLREFGPNVINVVLLGSDRRPGDGAWRTDVVILVSLDPDVPSATLLSFPRDLWVYIPGWRWQRINLADGRGEESGFPGGGPALIKQTLQYNFGIPVHYYARVDFGGFKQLIDQVGGVDVAADCPLYDIFPDVPDGQSDILSGVELSTVLTGTIDIPIAGVYHLDGKHALWYARSRKTTSDFDRSRRQQRVLRALWSAMREQDLLTQVPQVWDTFAQSVETDLTLNDMLYLAGVGARLRPAHIRSRFIDGSMLTWHITESGASVLRYRYDEIAPYLDETFAPLPKNFASQAPALVDVLNRSGRPGWERVAADRLGWAGFSVSSWGSADSVTAHTAIVDHTVTAKGSRLEALADVFQVAPENVLRQPDPNSPVAYRVIVGEDFEPCQRPSRGRWPALPPTPVGAVTPPAVSIVYPMVEPRGPQSGYRAYPGDTVEFRWILGDAPIKSDERYLVRLYAGSSVVDSYLTPDPWRHYQVPPGATGEFTWTVTVVRVDAAGSVIGALSPESQPWAISWQP